MFFGYWRTTQRCEHLEYLQKRTLGDKHLHVPENYRPISLTSVTCKILEHIICRHLLKHLEKNKILTNLNHGFRSGYSCETQLITTINDFLQEHDKGQQVDIAILDFSKAFNTVPHDKLLHKLEQYSIKGNVHSWLTNFLHVVNGCPNYQITAFVFFFYFQVCWVGGGVVWWLNELGRWI